MATAKKKSNKRLYLILAGVLVAVIVLAAIGRSQGWIGKPPTKRVQLAEAEKATIVEQVSASGRVQPVEEVSISAEVSGEIKELYVEEGDSVHIDTPLLKVRPDNLLAIVERAQATLNTQKANLAQSKARLSQSKAQFMQAELNYKRNKELYEQEVISAQEFETAEANFETAKADMAASEQSVEAAKFTVLSAEASLDEARKNLGLTNVYSPMEGIITYLAVEKGETVLGTQQMQGTEILRIANLNEMEVRVNVNENDIIRVSVGDTAIIDVDSYSYMNERFKGVVTSIANSANATASTDAVTEFEVKIRILNDSYKHLATPENPSPFRPGMTASVDIITEQKSDILTVPLAAVTTRKKENKKEGEQRATSTTPEEDDLKEVVFMYEDGKVKMVEVTTGISDFENIEILSGVEEGQTIVKGPFLMVSKTLKDGDLVENMEREKKKEENEETNEDPSEEE